MKDNKFSIIIEKFKFKYLQIKEYNEMILEINKYIKFDNKLGFKINYKTLNRMIIMNIDLLNLMDNKTKIYLKKEIQLMKSLKDKKQLNKYIDYVLK